jgi:phage protein D/phage baseplate assembly protein gpV
VPDIAPTTSNLTVKMNGTPLDSTEMEQLVSASVETNLNLPGRFSITFRDEEGTLVDSIRVEVGSVVDLAVQTNEATAKAFFHGEVTAIEAEFSYGGTTTTLRGYEKTHRLQAGRTSKVWVNAKYSDVVSSIIAAAGLDRGSITGSGPVLDWIGQASVSDWDLIQAMAAELGVVVTSTETGEVSFDRIEPDRGVPLAKGKEIIRARIGLSAAQQVTSIKVGTWDETAKEAVIGLHEASSGGPNRSWSPEAGAGRLGGRTLAGPALAQEDQTAAQTMADSIGALVESTAAELEATVFGDPSLQAGMSISISGFGASFDGTYVLSGARHDFERDGYRTYIWSTGRQDRSLLGLTRGGEPESGFRAFGVMSGVVSDNNDGEGLNRVKVQIPALDSAFVTDWSPVLQAGAGSGRGSVFVPEVGDQVLVAFQQNDIRRPVVIAGMHNGHDKPKISGEALVKDGQVLQRAVVSKSGQTLALIDESGKEALTLTTGDGNHKVQLNQGDQEIVVDGSGKVTIKGAQDVSVSSSTNVSVKADQQVSVQGTNVQIKADGQLQLQGATVKIASDGPLQATGNPIQLN